MPVYHQYAEDLTGQSLDNQIVGELHTLSDRPVRVLVPKHGPFFVESLILYDNLTQRPLVKGVDYRVPMIVREATLRTGKEIGDAILIENTQVSAEAKVGYQALGGNYQNNIDNIVQIYESYLNDNRSVDWLTGIYGKPTEFPPAPHPHWLTDLYGFEPLVVELERLVQAVLLGNTPAFEQLYNAMASKAATLEEMDAGLPIKKFVTVEDLLSVVDKYNFNSMTIAPEVMRLYNGKGLWVGVKASYVPDDVRYYWSIEHVTSSPADFVAQTGYVNLTNGEGRFMVQAFFDEYKEVDETFRVLIRRNSGQGQIVARTKLLTLAKHADKADGTDIAAMKACCIYDPRVTINARTYNLLRSRVNASYS